MIAPHSRSDEQSPNVWIIDLDVFSRDDEGSDTLSDEDRAQAERLRQTGVRRRFLARRSATRSILAQALGSGSNPVVIDRSCPTCGSRDHGRPTVAGSSLTFSVTSSGALAAVATSLGPVGVDLEMVRPGIESTAKGLTSAERNHLRLLPINDRPGAFARLWTAKEAVLKSCQLTLADDPAGIEAIDLFVNGRSVLQCRTERRNVAQWALTDGEGEKALVTVAQNGTAPIIWHDLGGWLRSEC